MTKAKDLAYSGRFPAGSIERKNHIINGNFDVWQRGTSLAAATGTRFLADRWFTASATSTIAPSQQAFAAGQTDVPGNPLYFHRSVVVTGGTAASYALMSQKIAMVRLLSNNTVTVSFWAKADTTRKLSIELIQNFGTGGSPSTPIEGIGVTSFDLSSSWRKFTATIEVPNTYGNTLGTDIINSGTNLVFWFDAGSNFNSRSSIGNQSGTFDIAQVQLEIGFVATDFETRFYEEELRLCQRYYQSHANLLLSSYGASPDLAYDDFVLPVSLRPSTTAAPWPSITVTANTFVQCSTLVINNSSTDHVAVRVTMTSATAVPVRCDFNLVIDAEI
jgi:hypothetical protein